MLRRWRASFVAAAEDIAEFWSWFGVNVNVVGEKSAF